MSKSFKYTLLICLLLGLLLGLAAGAGAESMDPQAIRQEIQQLRMRYTDKHPDVQILKRRLQKAEKLQKDREARQLARERQEQEASSEE